MFKISVSSLASRIAMGFAGTALVGGLGLLAGCPAGSSSSSGASAAPVARGAAFSGTVFGGRQPVVGSRITVYMAGQGGMPAPVIATATTDAHGNFSVAGFAPVPGTGAIVYVTAAGGDGSGSDSSNTAILMGTVAGVCEDYGCTNLTNVNINELATTAMVYSMGGFTSITGTSVNVAVAGNDSNALAGLTNAAATFANLVNSDNGTGNVPGTDGGQACTGSGEPVNCAALETLNTLANIAAACVNSPSAGAGVCTSFFNGTTAGGNVPANVFQALYNVATASAVRNAGATLYALNPLTKIYTPGLQAAPNAWTLALNYTGNGLDAPMGIAVDAAGNVWVANNAGNSISEFSPIGAPILTTSTAGLVAPIGIAVGPNGNVWTANNGNSSISEFQTANGTFVPPIATVGSGISQPYGIGFENFGGNGVYLGTANFGNSSVTGYSFSTSIFTGPITSSNLSGAMGIASGAATGGAPWATSYNNGYICKFGWFFFYYATCVGGNGQLDHPVGIALGGDGNLWIASSGNNTINYYYPGVFFGIGATFGSDTGYTGGGLDSPYGVAIDADGNIWVSNYGTTASSVANCAVGSVSQFKAPASGTVVAALSPSTGYTGGGLCNPAFFSIAVDASGNLWVSNSSNDSLTEFIGLAAPTRTPLVAATGSDGFTP